MLKTIWVIAEKDLRLEWRRRERFVAMASFTVLTGVLFRYALDVGVDIQGASAGLIWLTIIFSGVTGLGRTFQIEREDGAMTGLLTAPIPLSALFLGKALANTVLGLAVAFLTLLVFSIFFNLSLGQEFWALVLVIALGVSGFIALGTFFSAITVRSTMGSTLLPILLFPLLVPVVMFGGEATMRLFSGRPVTEIGGLLRLLAAFFLLALASGSALFRLVVED